MKINAINNKTGDLTVDPGASGDSYVQFDINTTGEFRIGVDDDASDAFKISQGSALGANDCLVITANGEQTLPLQPAFAAYLSVTDNNATGNGTAFTIGSGNVLTEQFDVGSDFVTTGTFTAPVTGKYFFTVTIKHGNLTGDGTATNILLEIVTSNRSWAREDNPGGLGNRGMTFGVLADMDDSDTTTFQVTTTGMNSDAGNLQDSNTWVSGALAT